jgi:hypothetical protein
MVSKGNASGAMTGRIVSMVAKYSSVCKCGAFIEPGDCMSYDTLTRKSLCYDCLRRNTEFAAKGPATLENQPADSKGSAERDECYSLIDRFRELRLSPRPLSDSTKFELKNLLIRFINEYGKNEAVRAFVSEIAKCKHSGAEYCPIKAKFPSACIHCGTIVSVGQLVLYDHHVRRIHCLLCDCMRGL